MRVCGRVLKEGKFWLAEIPILDAMTQGRTRKEAYAMVKDLVESLVNRPGFEVRIHRAGDGDFEIAVSETRYLIALVLRRQRQASGLSLADVARRLGARSRNAYARYEQATAIPTVERFAELLAAVSDGRDFVLRQSAAA
jgi:ribosome-binding protein aMBF1 (putative translation factor)